MHQSAVTYLQARAKEFGGRAAIVGKGPSFAEFDASAERSSRFIVGLNETPIRSRCHASFVIDEDILHNHGAEILASGIDALITPRVPHRKTASVGGLSIYGAGDREGAEATWAQPFVGRHYCFNLSTAEPSTALGDTFQAFNFSAPTLANLMAAAGFNDVLLAGVDGGTSYASDFKAFEYKKLRSVQSDFDVQFAELRSVRDRFGMKFRSVRCNENWILIGADSEQVLATEVLKWSIEARTFLSVRYCDQDPQSRSLFAGGDAGTPFSFQRIFLPQLAERSGRGLYFDSDMLIFKDVYELFNRDMGGHVLLGCQPTPGRIPQYSVFLVDNARATWNGQELLNEYRGGRLTYNALMKDFCFAEPKAMTLPMEWNSLEVYDAGRTANIHFTDMGTQPWLSIYNPNAELWCEALFEALERRPEARRAFELSVDRGWIRPSLKWQVDKRRSDPWSLPREVKRLDREWLPPHVELRSEGQARASLLLKWRVASRVRRFMQSRSYVRLMRASHALRKVF